MDATKKYENRQTSENTLLSLQVLNVTVTFLFLPRRPFSLFSQAFAPINMSRLRPKKNFPSKAGKFENEE